MAHKTIWSALACLTLKMRTFDRKTGVNEISSEKIDSFYTKGKTHYVTIAKWTGEWGPSYEVGLRDLKTNEFTLAASYLPTEGKARAAGKAIAKLAESGETLDDITAAFPGLLG